MICAVTYFFNESTAVVVEGSGGNLDPEESIPSLVVWTANLGSVAEAACSLSAASLAARISLRLWPPSTSSRGLRTLMSRFASEGTNLRFFLPSAPVSSSSAAASDGTWLASVAVPDALPLVIQAGKLDTPLRPVSSTDGALPPSTTCCCICPCNCCTCSPGCCPICIICLCLSSSSLNLLLFSNLSLLPTSNNSFTFFPILSVIISTRRVLPLAFKFSKFRLNANTARTTSGALSGSASSS
mmetsp:Transcript_2899/g.6242  ORF Transcript_2899/g.6242 Transcript_2899/m.6242 type:complete len:242 (+) Transcript_2899:554-1279(+)